MPFPSIIPLYDESQLDQSEDVSAGETRNGTPWVREWFTPRNFTFAVVYLLSQSEWASLESHYATNYETEFEWEDYRFSPSTTRDVYYTQRPRVIGKDGAYLRVVVNLITGG